MRSLRVLYVTSRHDAPYRYRCLIPCLHLRAEGIAADILHVRDPRLPDCLVQYSIVVLFRLPWSTRVERIAQAANATGARLVFDIDDLVFDPDAVKTLPFLSEAPGIVRAQYAASSKRLFATFQACDAFVGATPALQRHAAALEKPAYVYPNLLHPRLVEIGRRVRGLRDRLQRHPTISYFSGSSTHDADFAMVAPVLQRILSTHRDARLIVCGFLNAPESLGEFANRIIRVPFVDWRVQPWLIGLSRVNLAPIARIDAFAHAKSSLKFFEAGVVGVPTVASPTEPFVASIKQARNGYVAADSEAWHAAINTLLNREVATRVGNAARETAIEKHSIAGHRHELRELFLAINGRIKHPSPVRLRLPEETPDYARAASKMHRRLAAVARLRSVIGILRRAGRPEALHQAEAGLALRHAGATVWLDDEIASSDKNSGDLLTAIVQSLRMTGDLFAVFGDEKDLRANGVSGFHAFPQDAACGWQTVGYDARPMESVPIDHDVAACGHALVSMAVRTDEDHAFARLGWKSKSVGGTKKTVRIDYPLVCDGAIHHYLVDIGDGTGGAAMQRVIEFAPLSVPGEYRIDRLVFVKTRGVVKSGAGG